MLVLDNCQDAAGDTFHLILREACEELPQSTCLIALSRARLPDELARHAANQRVLNIAWDALRLTPDETRTIAKSNNERASTLHAQCGDCGARESESGIVWLGESLRVTRLVARSGVRS